MEKDCVFCKIVAGEIPSYKVYEDDKVVAFLDTMPINYGHTLIIPKQHIINLEDISNEDLSEIMKVVKIVGKAVKDGLAIEGYNILSNNDPIAGQSVPHLHFHIIPRVENDGHNQWVQGTYKNGEEEATIKKLQDAIK